MNFNRELARRSIAHSPIPNRRTLSGRAMPWLLWLVVIVVAGAAFWWWYSHRQVDGTPAAAGSASAPGGAGGRRFGGAGGARNTVQPVSIQTVQRQDIRVSVNAIGALTASNTATVHAQVGGVLQSLAFKEGQQVQAGQLLAQIDPRAFQAALGQAEGALARDKAQLDNARIDLQRYRDLLTRDAIAKQQVDTQEATVRQFEGTVVADQASVDAARLQLSFTRVTAPISGRVGLKQVDLGNVVSAGDTNGIVTIAQTRPIALVFSVPAANVPLITTKLRAHEPVSVEAWGRGGPGSSRKPLAIGRIETVDNAIDAATDTIKVKAVFPNTDDTLFPNQAVSVVLQLDTLEGVLAVPPAAVLRGSQGFYVYIVNADNTVGARVVKPGAVDGNWMAVDGQLEVGEKVVIDGVDRLREGAKVEVIAADPAQRAGASAPAGGGKRRGARGEGASAAASGSAAIDRQRWMDSVPPDVAEKLKAMSPEERRAYFAQRRQQGASAPAN